MCYNRKRKRLYAKENGFMQKKTVLSIRKRFVNSDIVRVIKIKRQGEIGQLYQNKSPLPMAKTAELRLNGVVQRFFLYLSNSYNCKFAVENAIKSHEIHKKSHGKSHEQSEESVSDYIMVK